MEGLDAKKQPNFIVAGAAKSGSTSLYEYLKGHPQVFLPDIKESRFLACEKLVNTLGYNRTGVFSAQDFWGLYKDVNDSHKAIGDFGNVYMLYPELVIPKIKSLLGSEVKIVFVIRNPLPRVVSAYKMARRNFYEDQSLEKGLLLEEARLEKGYVPPDIIAYYRSGDYYPGIKAFSDQFETHVMLLEELLSDPKKTMDALFDFLEIDRMELTGLGEVHNKGGATPRGATLFFRLQKAAKAIGAPLVAAFPWLRKVSSNFFMTVYGWLGRKKVDEEVVLSEDTQELLKKRYRSNTEALSKLIGKDLIKIWKLD